MNTPSNEHHDAAEAAKRLMNKPAGANSSPEDVKSPNYIRRRIVVGAAALAIVAVSSAGAYDTFGPKTEIGSAIGQVDAGEGLNDAVYDAMGELKSELHVNPSSLQIEDMTSAAGKEWREADIGTVQPGDKVEITAYRSPLFGNTSYDVTQVGNIDISDVQLPTLNPDTDTLPSPKQK